MTASEPAGGDALRKAAEEFCRRVEAGEVRSKRSYAAFKAALSSSAGPAEPIGYVTQKAFDELQSNPDDPRTVIMVRRPAGPTDMPRVALYAHPAPATED